MLHQIRKMVGTVMSVCRGYVEPDFIQKAFSPTESAQLPVAPALGLLLEQVIFILLICVLYMYGVLRYLLHLCFICFM